ncbi:MAG: hypothetical protein NWE93_03025 [Candidatus Bathyarchaeota archaeon]|nr:hypothetical protein [Candidatus Bathyarchaeota archaeon]
MSKKTKPLILAVIAVLLVSSLALTVEYAAARPIDQVKQKIIDKVASASWLKLNGVIDQWGDTQVGGVLQTQARTATLKSNNTNHFAAATAIWTENDSRPIQSVRSKENFTYSYYVARLANVSVTDVNTDPLTYSIQGTWAVANITSQVTVVTDENGTVVRVHRDQDSQIQRVSGTLTIADNKFTLSLDGMNDLTGSVYRTITRGWHNPFKVTDDATSSIVTTADIKAVGKCYGAMPGWGNYNMDMDFNNNYRVDVADISTVAANV